MVGWTKVITNETIMMNITNWTITMTSKKGSALSEWSFLILICRQICKQIVNTRIKLVKYLACCLSSILFCKQLYTVVVFMSWIKRNSSMTKIIDDTVAKIHINFNTWLSFTISWIIGKYMQMHYFIWLLAAHTSLPVSHAHNAKLNMTYRAIFPMYFILFLFFCGTVQHTKLLQQLPSDVLNTFQ